MKRRFSWGLFQKQVSASILRSQIKRLNEYIQLLFKILTSHKTDRSRQRLSRLNRSRKPTISNTKSVQVVLCTTSRTRLKFLKARSKLSYEMVTTVFVLRRISSKIILWIRTLVRSTQREYRALLCCQTKRTSTRKKNPSWSKTLLKQRRYTG